jgi:hypothetical protein
MLYEMRRTDALLGEHRLLTAGRHAADSIVLGSKAERRQTTDGAIPSW